MGIASRRVLTAISLGLAAALLPVAADACEDDGRDRRPDLTLAYVYRKIDATAPASWANSGEQRLILVSNGHRWNRSIDVSLLPDDVCGPGWAVQEDQTHGLPRADVPPIVDRARRIGVLGWPPIVEARHRDLERYMVVPPCDVPPVEEEPTPPPATPTTEPTQITSEPVVTPPAVEPAVEPAAPAVPVLGAPSFAG